MLEQFLSYSIRNGYPDDIVWITDMLTKIEDTVYEDKYIKKDNNRVYLKIDNDLIEYTNDYNAPITHVKQTIVADNTFLPIIKDKIETTVGRLIMNYLLVYKPFKGKIDYINTEMSFKKIEKIIENSFNTEKDFPNKITVDEYKTYMNSMLYILNFSFIYSYSLSKTATLPAPNIDEYKKQLIEEMKKKYGERALDNKVVLAEIDTKLLEYDLNYIKSDKTFGKLMSGKALNARKKMFISFGLGSELSQDDKEYSAKYVEKSLIDGYPKDRKKLAAMFNDSRAGSFARGAETQKGGVVAKTFLRVTNYLKVHDTDCGTDRYILITITDDNAAKYLYRYIIENNSLVELNADNIKSYIGKTVKMRSPMYCKHRDGLCKYCMNTLLSEEKDKPYGVLIMVSETSAALLSASLKKMHQSGAISTVDLGNIADILK